MDDSGCERVKTRHFSARARHGHTHRVWRQSARLPAASVSRRTHPMMKVALKASDYIKQDTKCERVSLLSYNPLLRLAEVADGLVRHVEVRLHKSGRGQGEPLEHHEV